MSGYARGAKDLRHRLTLTDQQLHDKRAEEQLQIVRATIDGLLELRYTLAFQLALIEP